MYRDADLHLATNRLLLLYQDSDDEQIIFIKDLSDTTLAQISDPYAQGPRWSPDGQKFAYFGNGRLYIHRTSDAQRIRTIEMPDHQAGFCEWSPSGESLIFSTYNTTTNMKHPPNIYEYDFADESITQVTDNQDVDRFPKWNHAGTHIACHRSYQDNDQYLTQIAVVSLQQQHERVLSKQDGFSQRISLNCWSPDDSQIIVTEYGKDEARLLIYEVATGEIVWTGEDTDAVDGCFDPYTGRVIAATKNTLSIYELPSQTPIAQLDLTRFAPVKTTLCGLVLFFAPDAETIYFLGWDFRFYRWQIHHGCEAFIDQPESIRRDTVFQRADYSFRASDGLDIPVQRYLPAQTNGRAIIFLEGGPYEAINPDSAIVAQLLAAGYEVIRPAYRGCGGYGDDHADANRQECGRADVRDVVECGIDWRQRFNKSSAPLAVSGFSYGGYLTFLALTHPDAVWTCGITFWGATMVPPLHQAAGLPSDPDQHRQALEERSPVKQAHRIHFPLLILHGDRDTTAKTDEVTLIRDRVRASNMPCRLVVFEGETHGLYGARPKMYAEMFAFLDEHMG